MVASMLAKEEATMAPSMLVGSSNSTARPTAAALTALRRSPMACSRRWVCFAGLSRLSIALPIRYTVETEGVLTPLVDPVRDLCSILAASVAYSFFFFCFFFLETGAGGAAPFFFFFDLAGRAGGAAPCFCFCLGAAGGAGGAPPFFFCALAGTAGGAAPFSFLAGSAEGFFCFFALRAGAAGGSFCFFPMAQEQLGPTTGA